MNRTDITIKDETQFKSIFFNTKKAKDFANKHNLRNDSLVPEKVFKINVTNTQAKALAKYFKEVKLTVFEF